MLNTTIDKTSLCVMEALGGQDFMNLVGVKRLVASSGNINFDIEKKNVANVNRVSIKYDIENDSAYIEFKQHRGFKTYTKSKFLGVRLNQLQNVFNSNVETALT